MHGDDVVDYSTVKRWVKQINDGQRKNLVKAIFAIGQEMANPLLLTIPIALIG